jgi:2-oxoisovalerate dehydrogenase E1 component
MPKNLIVDPNVVRRPGRLELASIEVNQPVAEPEAWRDELGESRLAEFLQQMVLIREFESMLDSFKRTGGYRGVSYNHAGPAHLSIGQEAAAVGQSAELGPSDLIFGSHRSHGEVLAKGLSAISQSEDDWLEETMGTYLDGTILRAVEKHLHADSAAERAHQFLCYGFLAEIFGRAAGFNRGLGGSMHAFFTPFGIYPNNAIVGGSAPIATGAALQRRVSATPGVVVATIGDAATGCGPVWESLNFASMGQLRTLWEPPHRGGLPIVFFVVNNFYGMGGQTIGETMGYERAARVGAGMRADNLHAETVDGQDPLAVLAAMRRARAHLEAGTGPVLLDVQTYRQSGHSPSDASTYRSREETELWRDADPINLYAARLAGAGLSVDLDSLRARSRDLLVDIARIATDLEISPRLDAVGGAEAIASVMFSNAEIELDQAPPAELKMPLAESSRARALASKSRSGLGPDGQVLSRSKAVQFRDAIFEALAEHVSRDGRVLLYGEENRDWDGAFGVYRGFTELLPYHRLFNSPISEAAIVGTAIGAAMTGGRPVVELMYADFLGRAGDEVFNQLAKWQAMSGGLMRLPVVLRMSVGSKYGAQHSQDWTSLVAHIPGLKVVYPATPYDAKGLMGSALAGSDPVIFLESQQLYDRTEVIHPEVPAEYYRIPIGAPNLVRSGTDITIVSGGPTLYRALEAATILEERYSLPSDVIDVRSIVPLNVEPILASVAKTGRLLIVTDSCTRGSWAQTLASLVTAEAFAALDAAPAVLGAPNWITPPAEMESLFFPTVAKIVDEVHYRLHPLPGRRPAGPMVDLRAESARGA